MSRTFALIPPIAPLPPLRRLCYHRKDCPTSNFQSFTTPLMGVMRYDH